MQRTKNDIQKEAFDKFLKLEIPKGTAVIGTGVGKSKLAIDIVKHYKPKKILLLVNSEKLRDTEWKNQFITWKAEEYWEVVLAECYQTVYKWENKEFEFVIADEFDFALTPEYAKFFLNNKIETLIALTAFIPEDKLELGNSIAPTFIEYSTQQGQEEEVLNKTQFHIVNYQLSENKTVKISYKDRVTKQDKWFMQSENGLYEYYEDKINSTIVALSVARRKLDACTLVRQGVEAANKKYVGLEWQLKNLTRKRKEFLHSLDSSAKLTKMIVKNLLTANPDNKVLIFSSLTSQADKISPDTYHSKNKSTAIEKLDKGEIKYAGVCQALNRGANLNGVNHIIKESYVGSETDFQQQHGQTRPLSI